MTGTSIHIVGMGLAGCCLAWQWWLRGNEFTWRDDERTGAASRVAAGLINPVTGKNFSPSWRIAEFLPEAAEFYGKVGGTLGQPLWFSLPVWRLFGEKEWPKVEAKLEDPAVKPWVDQVEKGRRAVVLKGGGRVATGEFCEASRRFFSALRRVDGGGNDPSRTVLCEGAAGLMAGRLGSHRCAKGEILSVRARGWKCDRIVIGGGGWLVPTGRDTFKVGSTYVWDRLDGKPTAEGRVRVEEIARLLGGPDFEVIAHEAGIRPIVRKSQPVIGPLADGRIVFNGLGSKGSLYAPGVARRLADWLAAGSVIDPELDVAFL